MIPTNEQIVAEAEQRRLNAGSISAHAFSLTHYIIEVVREGWTPPIDPDLLAVWGVLKVAHPELEKGWGDKTALWVGEYAEQAVLTAYKAGREAEAERAKVLLAALDDIQQYGGQFDGRKAALALNAYNGGL